MVAMLVLPSSMVVDGACVDAAMTMRPLQTQVIKKKGDKE